MHVLFAAFALASALHASPCETLYHSTKYVDTFYLAGNTCAGIVEFPKPRDSNMHNVDTIIGFDISKDALDISEACDFADVTCRFLGNEQFDGSPGAVTYSLGQAWKCDPITGICGDFYYTDILIDLDGDGQADMNIFCYGQLFLTEDNFILD